MRTHPALAAVIGQSLLLLVVSSIAVVLSGGNPIKVISDGFMRERFLADFVLYVLMLTGAYIGIRFFGDRT